MTVRSWLEHAKTPVRKPHLPNISNASTQDHLHDKQPTCDVYWHNQHTVYYASQSTFETVGEAL